VSVDLIWFEPKEKPHYPLQDVGLCVWVGLLLAS